MPKGNLFRFISIFFILGISLSARSQVQKADTISQIGLPEVSVTALRVPFKESTIPYSLSLVNARISTQGLSLSESISGLPGLEVNARYNYAVGDRITNRGFGARTQFGVRGVRIVFDDMPVTFADGQSNLEMIDLQNLSYVELLRGPGSSLYGNASGGVLILHSKPITYHRFLASVSTTAGSDGLFRWNGLLEGRIGKTELSGTYSDFHYSGYRDHATAGYRRALFKIISPLSEKDNLRIEAGVVKFNALNPGSLTKQESELTPGIANPASISNAAGQDGNQSQLAATWRHRADSISQFKLTIYGIHRSVVNPIIGKIVVLPQYSGGIVASFSSEIKVGPKVLSWNAGIESAARFNNRKNYINDNGQDGSLIINQEEQVIGTGAFLQFVVPVSSRLNLDACLRYDLTYFGFRNKLTAADSNKTGKRTMHALDPSVGLIYKLFKNSGFFANITTSFETPTSTELVNSPDGAGGFNPGLNPSRALEYEAGFRGSINPVFVYDFALYLIRTTDELIPFQVPAVPGQDYYRNAGSTIHRGGELTFQLKPGSLIDFSASLTYIDAFYKKFVVNGVDYSGNRIPGIGRVHEVAELKLHSAKGLYFSFLTESYGRMYVNDANSESARPYTIVDFGVGHEGFSFGKKQLIKVILSGGISNLFDKHYITAVTVNAAANRYYEPGPGRTFYLNTRFNFGIK